MDWLKVSNKEKPCGKTTFPSCSDCTAAVSRDRCVWLTTRCSTHIWNNEIRGKPECAAERRHIIMKESAADLRLCHLTSADAQHWKCSPTHSLLSSNTSTESTQSLVARRGNKKWAEQSNKIKSSSITLLYGSHLLQNGALGRFTYTVNTSYGWRMFERIHIQDAEKFRAKLLTY